MGAESYLLQRAHDLGTFLYARRVQVITFPTTIFNPNGTVLREEYSASLYPCDINIHDARAEFGMELLRTSGAWSGSSALEELVRHLEREIGNIMNRRGGILRSISKTSTGPPPPLSPADFSEPPSPLFKEAPPSPHSHVQTLNLQAAAGEETPSTHNTSDVCSRAGLITPAMSQSAPMGQDIAGEELRAVIREEVDAAVRRVLKSLLEGLESN